MTVRRNTLRRVPGFCMAAGGVSFELLVHIFLRPAVVKLPGNVVTMDSVRVLVIYGLLFLAVLVLGGLVFFRRMTRREVLLSAGTVALYGLVLTAAEQLLGPSHLLLTYLYVPFAWCSVVGQLAWRLAPHSVAPHSGTGLFPSAVRPVWEN